jgi:hypothetical protein
VQDAGGSGGVQRRISIRMDPVFAARPNFGILPGGVLAVHHESDYAIRLIDPAGRHVRTLTRAFTPRLVTEADKEAYQQRQAEQSANGGGPTMIMLTDGGARGGGGADGSIRIGAPGQGGGGGRTIPLNLDDVPYADTMAVVTGLRTDGLGRIWVQRRNEDGADRGPIDLVTPNGRYIGTLPPQPLPDAISADGALAAWIQRDDLGVERIAVRRLPTGWK